MSPGFLSLTPKAPIYAAQQASFSVVFALPQTVDQFAYATSFL